MTTRHICIRRDCPAGHRERPRWLGALAGLVWLVGLLAPLWAGGRLVWRWGR